MSRTISIKDKLESTLSVLPMDWQFTTQWCKDATMISHEPFDIGTTSEPSENVAVPSVYQPSITETFTEEPIQWWIGKVENVRDDYFVAKLRDLQGIESIAELDISSISEDQKKYVTEGSEFAYYVNRENHRGTIKTVSAVEFNMPYLWTEESERKAKKLMEELFPEQSSQKD